MAAMAGSKRAWFPAERAGASWRGTQPGVDVAEVEARAPKPTLPLAHRLALLYLAAPLGVWLIGWFEWWVGAPLAALLALALRDALRGPWRWSMSRAGIGLALAMLAWVLLFPAGGLFTPLGQDWMFHRAVFLDLGRGDWPTYLTEYVDREEPLLRYYLGYFIVPGLLGKWLGAGVLNWVVPLWTWMGMALLALLFARGLPSLRSSLLAVGVGVVLFSGADALQYVLREGPLDGIERFGERVGNRLSPVFLITRDSPMFLDYLSNALQFRNSPHHFIAGGIGTMLLLQLRGQPRFLAVVGVVLVSCAFWTAFAALGLALLALGLLVGNRVSRFLTWRNMVAAPALGALVGLYGFAGQVGYPHGWLWQRYDSGLRMAWDVSILYVGEFALLAVLLWLRRPALLRDPLFVASLLVLCAAPWYWYGDYDFSDLTLRVVVPALFVLGYHAARSLTSGSPSVKGVVARRFAFPLLLAVLGVGALSALAEFAAVLRRPGWLPYDQTRLTTLLSSVKMAGLRLAREPPAILDLLLRSHDNKGGTRGELVLRADYDLYLRGDLLVYARETCDVDFERTTRFFLRADGAGEDGQPTPRRFFQEFALRPAHIRRGHPCVHGRRLPAWAKGRVRLGQSVPGEGVVWEAEVLFDAGGSGAAWALRRSEDFFAARYHALRQAAARVPAARAYFDVYVDGDRVVFAKTPCVVADTTAKFFAHAFPVRVESLPRHRRGAGFHNLDFRFGARGALVEGGCATAAPLPSYALRRLRVGQWSEPDDRIVWQAEVALAPPQANGMAL